MKPLPETDQCVREAQHAGTKLPCADLINYCTTLHRALSLSRNAGHPQGASWSPVVVDFCSGGGHLGILVAHLLRHTGAIVCLVENKEESLRRAVERVEALGERGVTFP